MVCKCLIDTHKERKESFDFLAVLSMYIILASKVKINDTKKYVI